MSENKFSFIYFLNVFRPSEDCESTHRKKKNDEKEYSHLKIGRQRHTEELGNVTQKN